MTEISRRGALSRGALALLFMSAVPALAQEPKGEPKGKPAASQFKIVTVKDEIVIGLDAAELAKLGGSDAGAVARALKSAGTLTAWQYAVKKAANGDLQPAPLRKIGVIANDSLRVEPLATPLAVLPHE
jgi:hypothetical protein